MESLVAIAIIDGLWIAFGVFLGCIFMRFRGQRRSERLKQLYFEAAEIAAQRLEDERAR